MRARTSMGWSQEEAAERLAPCLGVHWSEAAYSDAERSYQGGSVRQFTADELFAMSRAFAVPVSYFFLLPPEGDRGDAEEVTGGGHPLNWRDLVLALFAGGDLDILPRLRELPAAEVPATAWETQGAPAWRRNAIREFEDLRMGMLAEFQAELSRMQEYERETVQRAFLAELGKSRGTAPADSDGEEADSGDR
jgi:transcriptional regulator with XRE-family HTH domain